MLKRVLICLLFTLLLSVPISAQATPFFEATLCPLLLPSGFSEGTGPGTIECGFVSVPEFHSQPDGNMIKVAVVIIHSTTPSPLPDPIFMEQGGPGGSTLELFVPQAWAFEQILNLRDIVLVEQRGTLYSEPALTCPEVWDATINSLDDDQPMDTFVAPGGAYEQCFNRLRAEGVNLSAFNSVENAADIISVADALDYDDINFYGVSYGTMLGQHLLRDFENRIRSIVLDAVVPLEVNHLTDSVITADEALRIIFNACATDFECNTRYPNLETTTFETVNNLNANPVLIPIYNLELRQEYDAFFNGDILLQLLRSLQYNTSIIPGIPAFIDAASRGDFEWVERLYGITSFGTARSIADGMHMSVLCAEDGNFSPEEVAEIATRAEFVNNTLLSASSYLQACQLAQVTPLGAYVNEPIISDVPALIISGQFDPITPPRYANILARNLENSRHIIFPGVGHGAITAGSCPITIISQFFFSPEVSPDTSCVSFMGVSFLEFTEDSSGRLQFPPPEELLDVSTNRYSSYQTESRDLVLSVMAIETVDVDTAIDDALRTIVRSEFTGPVISELYDYSIYGNAVTRFYQDDAFYILVYATNMENITAVVVVEFLPEQSYMIDYLFARTAYNIYPID